MMLKDNFSIEEAPIPDLILIPGTNNFQKLPPSSPNWRLLTSIQLIMNIEHHPVEIIAHSPSILMLLIK